MQIEDEMILITPFKDIMVILKQFMLAYQVHIQFHCNYHSICGYQSIPSIVHGKEKSIQRAQRHYYLEITNGKVTEGLYFPSINLKNRCDHEEIVQYIMRRMRNTPSEQNRCHYAGSLLQVN